MTRQTKLDSLPINDMNYRPLVVVMLLVAAGCPAKPTAVESGPPVIAVSQPVEREVQSYDEFTGRTDAVESVDIKARAAGYLVYIGFQPGSIVRGDEKPSVRTTSLMGVLAAPRFAPLLAASSLYPGRGEGDLLFIIDQRPYQAEVDKANAQIDLSKAKAKLAAADLARAREVAKTPGAISQQELDKYVAARDEADAGVKAAQANAESAVLNLEFCRLTAPTTGKVSRNYLTYGNLVTKDETLLTTIVSEDPIFAYVDIDERTILRVQKALREGKIPNATPGTFPIQLGLANEPGRFPHQGVVDFVNNVVDASTGTITLRGVFDNPKPSQGPRLFTPGEFVRIRLPLGEPYRGLLVSEKAFTTDQGQKILYVVDQNDTVQYRKVTVGPLQPDNLRVVTDGVKAGEWVIVSGLQDVRPGLKVSPERVPMPATKPAVLQ